MDEQPRNDYRHDNRNQNHRNRNRFRHGGGGGHQGGGQNRGRVQRPLLTSAINAAGLSLVALFLTKENPAFSGLLSLAVVLFGFSALISYAAQRLRPKFIELVSDALFIGGVCVFIYIGLHLGGYV